MPRWRIFFPIFSFQDFINCWLILLQIEDKDKDRDRGKGANLAHLLGPIFGLFLWGIAHKLLNFRFHFYFLKYSGSNAFNKKWQSIFVLSQRFSLYFKTNIVVKENCCGLCARMEANWPEMISFVAMVKFEKHFSIGSFIANRSKLIEEYQWSLRQFSNSADYNNSTFSIQSSKKSTWLWKRVHSPL